MRRSLVAFTSAVAAAAAAGSVASPELLAIAIGLLLLTAVASLAVALASHLTRVERMISEHEVLENVPVRLRFEVHGKPWLPVRVEVEDHRGRWVAVKDSDASVELHVGRPGTYRLAPTRLRLRDAVGIFERQLLAGRVESLLVLPAPHGRARREAGPAELLDDLELQGLQPYKPGAPVARVHWPTLARGAGLHVRHIAPPRDCLPLVVVDTRQAPSSGALDWAARVAAGYVLTLAREGGCRVLLPGDTRATSVIGLGREWRAVHRRLAMLRHLAAGDPSPRADCMPALHVRAAMAPTMLAAAPPLPQGVQFATQCSTGRG